MPRNSHPESPLLEAIELGQLRRAIVQSKPSIQADSEALLLVRKADLERFLSSLSVVSLPPAPVTLDVSDPDNAVRKIQVVVADEFEVPIPVLLGRSRRAPIAWARQVAMHLCLELTNLSSNRIAAAFKRDHGTVLFADRAVRNRLETDPSMHAKVAAVKAKLKNL